MTENKKPFSARDAMADAWIAMRVMREAETANIGYRLMEKMCENCLENRAQACEKCLSLHNQVDNVEKSMPRNILFEEFKFDRSKEFLNNLQKRKSK